MYVIDLAFKSNRKRFSVKETPLIDFGTDTQRSILALIRQQAPTTRAALAETSGLTPAAITKITKKMLDEGLIVVTGKQQGAEVNLVLS